jgi:hypothetical protein
MCGKVRPRLGRDIELFIRQPDGLARRLDILYAGLAVSLIGAGNFWNAFPDERLCDDKLRFAALSGFRFLEYVEDFVKIVAVDGAAKRAAISSLCVTGASASRVTLFES